MSIYVIADLHLSFKEPKPMHIFGNNWTDHPEKIRKNWLEKVKEEDLVVLPGDFSWAMHLEDTYEDFKYLNSLPGKKLLLKGNHDYWWTTLKKMREFLKKNNFSNIDFIYNNSYMYENTILTGTRGWAVLDSDNSKKMIKREDIRLKLAIEEGIKEYGTDKEIIVFMHYPPLISKNLLENPNLDFYKTLKQYNIKKCYYGHLHGNAHKDAVEGEIQGINFSLISADYLQFDLKKIK